MKAQKKKNKKKNPNQKPKKTSPENPALNGSE